MVVARSIPLLQPSLAKQHGMVLITGIIFLIALTLIVLSVMRGAMLEERMASNVRNRQLALQASEAMLRDVKTIFAAAPFSPFDISAFTTACVNGYCKNGSVPDWGNSSKTRTFANTTSQLLGVSSQPSYYVEHIYNDPPVAGRKCPTVLFRITVRGVGQDSSEIFTQGIYRHLPVTFAGNLCG
jgi:type IV pilus assembly protein PilX